MYIQPISSITTPSTLENENQIKILEMQLNDAQDQLLKTDKIKEDNYDAKQEKIKRIQAQIQQIQMQIEKIREEQKNKEIQNQTNNQDNKELLKSNYVKKIDTIA